MYQKYDIFRILVAVMVLVSLTVGIASAAPVTQSINYQGKLTDAAGNPLTGTYTVTFNLYDVSSGGTALATDIHSVTASKGLFTTQITADPSFFDGRALWLGIKVGADTEMTPRQELRPVPYALSLRPGARITSSDESSALNLQNKGGGNALNALTTGPYSYGVRASTSGGPYSYGVFASTSGINSHGVYASTSGGPYSYGVLASTSGGPYSYGVYASTSGINSHGVYASTSGKWSDGVSAYTAGTGSTGVSTYTSGINSPAVYASTTNASSTGVSASTTGTGSYGVFARTGGDSSDGVYAYTSGPSSSGVRAYTTDQYSHGLYASTEGTGSYGVYATTTNASSTGVYAYTAGTDSSGIYASTAGQYSDGVVARTTGADSYGVNAYSGQSPSIWAQTGRSDNKYGVQTPDYIRALGYETGSSDVAEYMPVTRDVEIGIVVIIGPDGKLLQSTDAYDTRVAGIVSSDPGVFLGAKEGGNPGEQLIAVAGRVPCKVDATLYPIHAGDLLTTSNNPGYAMKATNPQIGTILGKAMGSLESGTGTIEVLVTLQ